MSQYDFDGEPFVVIEREDAGIGTFLLGVAMGAGIALLFAPRSGSATRQLIGDRAREAGDTVREAVADVTDSVVERAEEVRDRVGMRVDAVRDVIHRGERRVVDAFDAGRYATREARVELERRIAENKASRSGAEPGVRGRAPRREAESV